MTAEMSKVEYFIIFLKKLLDGIALFMDIVLKFTGIQNCL